MDVFRTRPPQSIQALRLSTKGRFFKYALAPLRISCIEFITSIVIRVKKGKRRQGLTIQPDMFDIVTM